MAGSEGTGERDESMMTPRAALIVLISAVIGGVMGLLAAKSGVPVPAAVATGLTAAGVSLLPANRLIGRGE